MASQYVLIDYENVQPKSLAVLAEHSFNVLVFFGVNQTKVSIEFMTSIQRLADSARVIQLSAGGKNALDFYIAYYLGDLATREPHAKYHVISKDTGFDPLLKHLKSKGVDVHRVADLAEIPDLRIKEKMSDDEKIDAVVKNLAARGQSRPRKVSTLQNTINTLFTRKLSQKELTNLVDELARRKYISVNQSNVSYSLQR